MTPGSEDVEGEAREVAGEGVVWLLGGCGKNLSCSTEHLIAGLIPR